MNLVVFAEALGPLVKACPKAWVRDGRPLCPDTAGLPCALPDRRFELSPSPGCLVVCAAGASVVTVFDSTTPISDALTPARAVDLELLRGGLRIIALRALGDPDAADEAVQETLSRAVIALADGRLTDRAKLAAYVAGIARHVCSHMRRDRKDTVSLDGDDSTGGMPPVDSALATHADPLEALITEAETERLRLAFRALSHADQQLLRLCFHDEQTPAEVAATLDEPPERVRKRKSRALDRLRRAFLGNVASHDPSVRGINKEEGDAARQTTARKER